VRTTPENAIRKTVVANEQQYGPKSQAIRDYLTENPGVSTSQVVDALAIQGTRVSLSFVATVQAIMESQSENAPEAEDVTISVSYPDDQPPPPVVKKKPSRKKRASGVAADVKPVLQAIVDLTDAFCQEFLNEEYAEHCRKLAAALARKRPSPLMRGKVETWACGIVRTIGWVNYLDDPNREPHMKLTFIDKAFRVAESTGQGKSKMIRKLLKIRQFDPKWTLPSRTDDHPLMWMVEVDGFLIDMRHAPPELQEAAFRRGLIPHIPGEPESTL
jgi:hypothetical protein